MSEIDILDKLNVLERRINELQRMEHTSTVARWTDYSATSTIVGWSSFTTKKIYYARIGNLVFVGIDLAGTSNFIHTTFTTPYNAYGSGLVTRFIYRARDNSGSYVIAFGAVTISSDIVNLYPDLSGGNWINNGTKECAGQFWYWCA